jgi:uncharacterized membrane protein YuzA (DUF378 family)
MGKADSSVKIKGDHMKVLDIIAAVLLIIGGLNWGVMGVSDMNVISSIFGSQQVLLHIIYILVGLSAVYSIIQWRSICHRCKK